MPKITKSLKKLKLRDFLVYFLLVAVIVAGNFLRTRNYDTIPHPGETTDEYGFAWAGLSLIKDGVPTSWSGVDAVTRAKGFTSIPYKSIGRESINVDKIFDNNPTRAPFIMVSPWFDKPPAFALLVGSYSYFKGAREFVQTGVGIIRRPMLKIAILTTVLIFILATQLYGKWAGVLSALFYSVLPTPVISSRVAMAENGYIPIFLAALIFINLYLKKQVKVFLVIAAALSAAAILFKTSGIAVLLSLLLLLAAFHPKKGKIKAMAVTFAIGILGFVAFAVYGYLLNWRVFIDVFTAQSNLFYGAGAAILFSVLTNNKIVIFFTDGWMLLAWISAFIISFSEWKKERGGTFLSIAMFACLVVFLFFGSESYGWYRFPFIPFLIIFLSRFIVRLFKNPNLFVASWLLMLPLGVSVHKILGQMGFQDYVYLLRYGVIVALGVFGLDLMYSGKFLWAKRLIMLVLLIAGVIFAIREFFYFTYDNWFFVT